MELLGIMLRSDYYKVGDNPSLKIAVLSVKTLGDSVMVRVQMTRVWKPGRSYHITEKNKTFLVWNNEAEKLRLTHDGCWIRTQDILVKRTPIRAVGRVSG